MDLGLAGKKAIICGSSDGLGLACATSLAEAGVQILLNGRSPDRLAAAAEGLASRFPGLVSTAVADVTTAEGRAALFAAMPSPDILVTNAGGPPPGDFSDWEEEDWHRALQNNMVTPIMLIRTALPAMRTRKWGRIINITSGAVKAPVSNLGLSNGARTGLTGFVSGLARQVAAYGVTINNLLPGFFHTARLESLAASMAAARGVPVETVWAEMQAKSPMGRVGDPAEFGAACAWLASRQAAFITAQNILLDGGAFPGTL